MTPSVSISVTTTDESAVISWSIVGSVTSALTSTSTSSNSESLQSLFGQTNPIPGASTNSVLHLKQLIGSFTDSLSCTI